MAKYVRFVCATYMMPASSVVMVGDKLRSRPRRNDFGGEHDLTRSRCNKPRESSYGVKEKMTICASSSTYAADMPLRRSLSFLFEVFESMAKKELCQVKQSLQKSIDLTF